MSRFITQCDCRQSSAGGSGPRTEHKQYSTWGPEQGSILSVCTCNGPQTVREREGSAFAALLLFFAVLCGASAVVLFALIPAVATTCGAAGAFGAGSLLAYGSGMCVYALMRKPRCLLHHR